MTDINTYLTQLLPKLKPTDIEKASIQKSIEHLQKSIWGTFQDDLSAIEIFGSYDRGTMLSPSLDNEADVDVLVVFKVNKFQPQTYLNQIQKLSEKTYARSEVFPSHPTITVELEHIRFEIVPAYWEEGVFLDDLKIP